ncbi:hypothetical protein EB796_009171 [Bugula neritina]|uniref:Uncharacterized protein n=1 Tax=Bugula neritina TaxID=10212 RepID=A0A7J7K1Q2_BUGNE|nr:hypothetical protein EB796_009171 [Bugula neritina]
MANLDRFSQYAITLNDGVLGAVRLRVLSTSLSLEGAVSFVSLLSVMLVFLKQLTKLIHFGAFTILLIESSNRPLTSAQGHLERSRNEAYDGEKTSRRRKKNLDEL